MQLPINLPSRQTSKYPVSDASHEILQRGAHPAPVTTPREQDSQAKAAQLRE
jgi:hypothetical protein